MSSMPTSAENGSSPAACTASTIPCVAPEKVRICANVVAPTMMKRTMPEIAAVPSSAFMRLASESER